MPTLKVQLNFGQTRQHFHWHITFIGNASFFVSLHIILNDDAPHSYLLLHGATIQPRSRQCIFSVFQATHHLLCFRNYFSGGILTILFKGVPYFSFHLVPNQFNCGVLSSWYFFYQPEQFSTTCETFVHMDSIFNLCAASLGLHR